MTVSGRTYASAMRKGAISRDGVLKAVAEYDELGREGFLSKYGYKPATGYLLVHEERTYDSKAIVGVAHEFDQGRVLRPDELSGGRSHAARWLAGLGFVIRSSRSPDWTRDEIILACDLAMANGWKRLEYDDPRVVELSALLQVMPIHPEELRNELFRNPGGLARKTVDITSRHPDYLGKPTNGNVLDVEVMNDFLARPAEMTEVAQRIRQGLTSGDFQDLLPEAEEEDDYDAPEGKLLLRRHRSRERNKACARRRPMQCCARAVSSPVKHAVSTSSRSTATAEAGTSSVTTLSLCMRRAKAGPSSMISPSYAPTATA